MVSKFKSLSALEEILARRGQFWETIPTLEVISTSEAVRSGELPVYQVCFFLLSFIILLYS